MLKRIIPSGLIFMLLASGSPVPATNQTKNQTTYVKPGNDIQRKLDYFYYEGVKQKTQESTMRLLICLHIAWRLIPHLHPCYLNYPLFMLRWINLKRL